MIQHTCSRLTPRSARTRLIALQADATAPVETAFTDTSTKKKNTWGIGGRTYMHITTKISPSTQTNAKTLHSNREHHLRSTLGGTSFAASKADPTFMLLSNDTRTLHCQQTLRTMYSFGATNSTVPLDSSGLMSASRLLPSGPRLHR